MRTNLYKPQNGGSGSKPHAGAAPRRHRLKRLCALAIALFCGMQWAHAYDFSVTSGDNTYYFNITDATNKYVEVTYPNSNNVSWTGYTKPTGTLNIPGIVTYNGTSYTVTGIGYAAFAGCTDITYVGIPTTITSMDSRAFRNCTGITTVAIYSNAVMSENYTSSYNLTKIFGSQVTKYAIGNTVTTIGSCAFYGCTSLETVTIANSVSSIGSSAFEGCTSLGSVVLPNSLTTISNAMFRGCTNLASVTIPSSVTSVKDLAFQNCTALNRINITDLAAWCGIEYETFALPFPQSYDLYLNNTKVTNLTIPSGWTTIKAKTFAGCSSITSVTIPSSVTSVGSEAFSSCNNLNRVNISDLAAWCGITFPDAEANPLSQAHNLYLNNTKITNLSIPSGVSAIKAYVFYGGTGFTSAYIANSVATIGTSAFQGCSNMTQVTFTRESSATTFGADAFDGCTGLTKVYIPGTEFMCRANFSNAEANPLTYAHHLYLSGQTSEITTLDIYNIVSSIGPYAFSGGTGITAVSSVNPGYSVTSIGSGAFRGCTGLTSVTLTNSLTSIGSYAFDGCTGLASVTIPSSVTTLGYQAFRGCTNLTSVTINSNAVASADFTYQNYNSNNFKAMFGSQVTSYTFGSAVTGIGAYAMYGCSGMTSVSLPNSLTSIGSNAFSGCTGLPSVTMQSVATIGYGAFDDCTGLTSVTMPNVTTIDNFAFGDCTGLASVTIPSSVTTLGKYAFSGCTNLTSVTINSNAVASADFTYQNYNSNNFKAMFGNQVTSYTFGSAVTGIGAYAMYGCSGMTSVSLPNSLTSIGSNAFYSCTGITMMNIPAAVTSIGDYAFSGCSGMTEVIINRTTGTTFGTSAFGDCTGLTKLTMSDPHALRFCTFPDADANPLTYAHRLYDSSGNEVTTINIPFNTLYIRDYAFSGGEGITSLNLGEVPQIKGYAFKGCTGLTSVTIPSSVQIIDNYAFDGCTNLTSVTINSNHVAKKDYSYSDNLRTRFGDQVESYILGSPVTTIGTRAFNSCDMTSVTIGSGVTSIADYAFSSCRSLTEMHVEAQTPPTIASENTFYYVPKTIPVYVPAGTMAAYKAAPYWSEFFGTLPLPSDQQYTFVSPTQMQFSWTRNPGQTHISIDFADNETFVGANRINSSDTEFTVNFSTPLLPNTTYYIRAKAIYDGQNSGLVSEFTEAVSFITPIDAYKPTNLAAVFVSATQVDVSWTNVAGFTGSGFQFSAQEDFSATLTPAITSTGPSSMSLTFSTPLEPSTTYYVRVMNQFNAVQGPWSEAFELTTPAACAAPTSLAATNIGPFSATLSWTGDAEGYEVEYREAIANALMDHGFEYNTDIAGWNFVTNGGGSGWTRTKLQSQAHTGSCFLVSGKNNGDQNILNYAIFPVSELNGVLTFYAKKTNTIQNNLRVMVSTTDAQISSFTNVQTLTNSLTTAYQQFTIDLRNRYEGAGYIAIYHYTRDLTLTAETGVLLDDIAFTTYGGEWQSLGATTESTMALTGLTCGGTYQFRVRAACESGFMSDWATSANFSTLYNIVFEDAAVKALCVANWDANSDGELSYAEAAAVTSLGTVFYLKQTITKFNELQYFTGLQEIGDSAFDCCESLEEVTLPAQITKIGEKAFNVCSNLTSIVIPEGVTELDDQAFRYAGLQSLVLPNTMQKINNRVFEDCRNLTAIHLPASVFYMGTNPFCSTGIETITVDPANTVYASPTGSNAIIRTYQDRVVLEVGCKNTVVPENVTEIKNHAFYGCEGLTSITLPASVTTIGTEAFRGCRALTSITLPASVTTIGDYAFRNCGLTSATLGYGVTTIGNYAFSGCMSLTELNVEATTPPNLGTYSFGEYTTLSNIALTVPCEGLQAYKSHATWGQFNNVTECEYRFVNADFWYEPAGWLYGEVPGENDAVSIEAYCILDYDVTVASINILNTGTLDVDACTLTAATVNSSNATKLILNDGAQLKHDNNGVKATVYKSITGYGAANVNKSTGWHFIASPIYGGVYANRVDNLIANPAENYDLYAFVPEWEKEWDNLKDNYNSGYVNSMQGYLYANLNNVSLGFKGTLMNSNAKLNMSINETDPETGEAMDYSEYSFGAWRLLGNSFVCDAYITDASDEGIAYYVMNEEGDGYIPAEGAIAPMQGFFVEVPTKTESYSFYLSREAPTGGRAATLNANLSKAKATRDGVSAGSKTVIDRAIVHFGEGSTLEKLTFREGSTQLYIPMEGTDYAVVKAGTMGELPVSFKAETNGRYTLDFTNEEVTFSYLHLIDNLTGAETDLLQQPSYSFDARTTDYASRFRLQFATGTSENAEGSTFGFVNASGNFTVFGIDGEATLQVIDVTGRVLSSETFSGSYERKLDVSPGVYLMRLIHGTDVKTQKIVIE